MDFASQDREQLALAERLGAHPVETDLGKPARTYPIVVDAGLSPGGLQYAIRATEPEGICQSVSFHPGPGVSLPLGRMYTLGIRFFVGRCHAAALLPEVVGADRRGAATARAGHDARGRLGRGCRARGSSPRIKLVVRRAA